MKSRFLFTCSIQKKKRVGGRWGEEGERKMGYSFCSRGALLQRVKTLNIKACFGLEIGKRNEQGGEATRTYSQWSLLRMFAKERKKTCPG